MLTALRIQELVSTQSIQEGPSERVRSVSNLLHLEAPVLRYGEGDYELTRHCDTGLKNRKLSATRHSKAQIPNSEETTSMLCTER